MANYSHDHHDHAREPECSSRRMFLRDGALALLSLGFAPSFVSRLGAEAPQRRKLLITVFQRGAVDGLNMVVPFGEAEYYRARPSIAVARPGAADGAIDEVPEDDRERQECEVDPPASAALSRLARCVCRLRRRRGDERGGIDCHHHDRHLTIEFESDTVEREYNVSP